MLGTPASTCTGLRMGAAWALQTRLTGSNTSSGDAFGGSVALSAQGDVLAVGADQEAGSGTGANPPDDDNSPQSGAAYAFALLLACILFIFVVMRVAGVGIRDIAR